MFYLQYLLVYSLVTGSPQVLRVQCKLNADVLQVCLHVYHVQYLWMLAR